MRNNLSTFMPAIPQTANSTAETATPAQPEIANPDIQSQLTQAQQFGHQFGQAPILPTDGLKAEQQDKTAPEDKTTADITGEQEKNTPKDTDNRLGNKSEEAPNAKLNKGEKGQLGEKLSQEGKPVDKEDPSLPDAVKDKAKEKAEMGLGQEGLDPKSPEAALPQKLEGKLGEQLKDKKDQKDLDQKDSRDQGSPEQKGLDQKGSELGQTELGQKGDLEGKLGEKASSEKTPEQGSATEKAGQKEEGKKLTEEEEKAQAEKEKQDAIKQQGEKGKGKEPGQGNDKDTKDTDGKTEGKGGGKAEGKGSGRAPEVKPPAAGPKNGGAPQPGQKPGKQPDKQPGGGSDNKYDHLKWQPTKDTEIPGWDQEIAGFDQFKDAKSQGDKLDLDSFFSGTSQSGVGTNLAQQQQVDRDALIGEAIGHGAVEGLMKGVVSVGLAMGLGAAAQKLPVLGAVFTLAQFYDPKAWADSTAKSFTDPAKDIAAIANIGKAKSAWEALAIGMEFMLGILNMVRAVLSLVDTIMQVVGALCYIIGTILAAFIVTAPAAPALFSVATFLMSWSKVVGIINLALTLATLPFRALAMTFRALDLKFTDASPEELLKKREKLQKHTSAFFSDSVSSAGKLGMDKMKAKNPHPVKGGSGKSLKDDYKGAFTRDKLHPSSVKTNYQGMKAQHAQKLATENANQDKVHADNQAQGIQGPALPPIKGTTYTGMQGGKYADGYTSFDRKYGKLNSALTDTMLKGYQTGVDQPKGLSGLIGETDTFSSGKKDAEQAQAAEQKEALIQERIAKGSDEMKEPPLHIADDINASAVGMEELDTEEEGLQQLRSDNQTLKQEAAQSAGDHGTLIGTVEANRASICGFQEETREKQLRQDDAAASASASTPDTTKAAQESKDIQGKIGPVKPAIDKAVSKGQKEGANMPDPSQADPNSAQKQMEEASAAGNTATQAVTQGSQLAKQWKGQTQQADTQAQAEDAKLAAFGQKQEQNQQVATQVGTEAEEREAEFDAKQQEIDRSRQVLLAKREAAIAEGRAWVDHTSDVRRQTYQDVDSIMATGKDPSEDPNQKPKEITSQGIASGGSNQDLQQGNGESKDLSGQKLPQAKMAGADLSAANLSGADLTGADLTGADLSEANLSGAKLKGAKLNRADLKNANLEGADLSEADLTGADLRNVREQGVILDNAIGVGTQKP
jgi:hypothetical protein